MMRGLLRRFRRDRRTEEERFQEFCGVLRDIGSPEKLEDLRGQFVEIRRTMREAYAARNRRYVRLGLGFVAYTALVTVIARSVPL